MGTTPSSFLHDFIKNALVSAPEINRLYVALCVRAPCDVLNDWSSKPFGTHLLHTGVFLHSLVAVAVHRQIAHVLGEHVDPVVENSWTTALVTAQWVTATLVAREAQPTSFPRQQRGIARPTDVDLLALSKVVAPGHGCDMPLMDWCLHARRAGTVPPVSAPIDWHTPLPKKELAMFTQRLFEIASTWLYAWLSNPSREKVSFTTMLPAQTFDVIERARSKTRQMLGHEKEVLSSYPIGRQTTKKRRVHLCTQLWNTQEHLRLSREHGAISRLKLQQKLGRSQGWQQLRVSTDQTRSEGALDDEYLCAIVCIKKKLVDLDREVFSDNCVYAVTNLCVGSRLAIPACYVHDASIETLLATAYTQLREN